MEFQWISRAGLACFQRIFPGMAAETAPVFPWSKWDKDE